MGQQSSAFVVEIANPRLGRFQVRTISLEHFIRGKQIGNLTGSATKGSGRRRETMRVENHCQSGRGIGGIDVASRAANPSLRTADPCHAARLQTGKSLNISKRKESTNLSEFSCSQLCTSSIVHLNSFCPCSQSFPTAQPV